MRVDHPWKQTSKGQQLIQVPPKIKVEKVAVVRAGRCVRFLVILGAVSLGLKG